MYQVDAGECVKKKKTSILSSLKHTKFNFPQVERSTFVKFAVKCRIISFTIAVFQ